MSKLDQFIKSETLDLTKVLVEMEKEVHGDGQCPVRVWCFAKRLRVSKHAWPRHKCAFEQHHALWQCRESGNGHGRVLDRGDVTVVCAGAAFCKNAACPHRVPHRWKADDGCDRIKCRKLEAIPWDEEIRGERPDPVVVCEVV